MMTTLNNRVSALFADPLQNIVDEFNRGLGWDTNSNGTAIQQLAPMSLWEDDNSVHVEMDVPGMTIENLDVTIEKGKLRICGQRRAADRSSGTLHEDRYFGRFERCVALSDCVDPNSIEASLRDGVLNVKFSKKLEQPCQKVTITTGDSSVKKMENRRTIFTRVADWSWKTVLAAAVIALVIASVARADSSTAADDAAKTGPVVRIYGTEGGYRTEVKNETNGKLSEENRRQVALLTAQIFQHIDQAQRALDADRTPDARTELDKGRQAIKAVRALLPTTSVHTKTSAPDGTVIYEDKRDLQVGRIPLFEGMLSTKTLAPIIAAKQGAQDAVEVKGVRLIGAETITTEAFADLDYVEGQLERACKALNNDKAEAASSALELCQVRGVEFKYHKEDTPLAAARDALWLAKRALDENNSIQARANLNLARQQLEIYRQLKPEGERKDVTQMMTDVEEMDAKLRKEPTGSSSVPSNQANKTERTSQGNAVTRWWEQVNSWFKK